MKRKRSTKAYPIEYWSFSSLTSYLRNPLAWYKRYVLKIYDTPRSPASVVGTAGHLALENFYSGASKEGAVEAGLLYIRAIPDFEINFGVAKTRAAQKAKRAHIEKEYLQAISFYLHRAPRHKVIGVEVKGLAKVKGHALPIKAISDLVVESKLVPGAVDIVDHKFVDSFSKSGGAKPLFMLQAVFNYYTVKALYGKEPIQFLVYECKKTRNANGAPQLRRYSIDYREAGEAFALFDRLMKDVTNDMKEKRTYLPNPSDMFDGEDSFELYRLKLLE